MERLVGQPIPLQDILRSFGYLAVQTPFEERIQLCRDTFTDLQRECDEQREQPVVPRSALRFLYGPAGAGKTFTLLEMAKYVDTQPSFKSVAITFNGISTIDSYEVETLEKYLVPSQILEALVTIRIWFAVGEQREFRDFFHSVVALLRQNQMDASELSLLVCLKAHHERVEAENLVLFVDELVKFASLDRYQRYGDDIRTILCREQDLNPNFRVIFSSLNYDLMQKEAARSNRPIKCISLVLSSESVCEVLGAEIDRLKLPTLSSDGGTIPTENLLKILVKLVGCHPRALGTVIHDLNHWSKPGCEIKDFLEQNSQEVVNSLANTGVITSTLPDTEAFLKVVLGCSGSDTLARDELVPNSVVKWSRLLDLGCVLDASMPQLLLGDRFRPSIPPMLLRFHMTRLNPNSFLAQCLATIFQLFNSSSPKNFERFYLYFEQVRRWCGSLGIASLSALHPGSLWTNDLGETLVDVTSPNLRMQPCQKDEFPPTNFEMDVLYYSTWSQQPALEAVVFLSLANGSGHIPLFIQNKTGRGDATTKLEPAHLSRNWKLFAKKYPDYSTTGVILYVTLRLTSFHAKPKSTQSSPKKQRKSMAPNANSPRTTRSSTAANEESKTMAKFDEECGRAGVVDKEGLLVLFGASIHTMIEIALELESAER
eukprot:c20745_g1_i2.p1 GENE.c20745_g1_i2~~c20745_g1_i2.p1  ORF type:complete len:666 (-),score=126.64 c20745_g1_i2:481-2448(-)